jgi:hypothetical protein
MSQDRILVEIVGEVEKISGRCSDLPHDPHGKFGLRNVKSQQCDICM